MPPKSFSTFGQPFQPFIKVADNFRGKSEDIRLKLDNKKFVCFCFDCLFYFSILNTFKTYQSVGQGSPGKPRGLVLRTALKGLVVEYEL